MNSPGVRALGVRSQDIQPLVAKHLFAYNCLATSLWALVLFGLGWNRLWGDDRATLYQRIFVWLYLGQAVAIMEPIHIIIGMVRAPLFTTVIQVFSRLWVLFGIIFPFREKVFEESVTFAEIPPVFHLKLSVETLLMAWSLSEIIRYSFYALKERSQRDGVPVPYLSTWMRYSAFIVLYPLGVASELACVVLALPLIKESQLWTITMPNRFNFAFDYHLVCLLIVVGYLPGLPLLYNHMLQQRKKVLAAAATQPSSGAATMDTAAMAKAGAASKKAS